jgi:hypothetical protein
MYYAPKIIIKRNNREKRGRQILVSIGFDIYIRYVGEKLNQ